MDDKKLKFPTEWRYSIIADDNSPEVIAAITEVLKDHNIDLQPEYAGKSRNGKYHSFRVKAKVESSEHLKELSDALNALEAVKFLL